VAGRVQRKRPGGRFSISVVSDLPFSLNHFVGPDECAMPIQVTCPALFTQRFQVAMKFRRQNGGRARRAKKYSISS